jgi:hypothetical protein
MTRDVIPLNDDVKVDLQMHREHIAASLKSNNNNNNDNTYENDNEDDLLMREIKKVVNELLKRVVTAINSEFRREIAEDIVKSASNAIHATAQAVTLANQRARGRDALGSFNVVHLKNHLFTCWFNACMGTLHESPGVVAVVNNSNGDTPYDIVRAMFHIIILGYSIYHAAGIENYSSLETVPNIGRGRRLTKDENSKLATFLHRFVRLEENNIGMENILNRQFCSSAIVQQVANTTSFRSIFGFHYKQKRKCNTCKTISTWINPDVQTAIYLGLPAVGKMIAFPTVYYQNIMRKFKNNLSNISNYCNCTTCGPNQLHSFDFQEFVAGVNMSSLIVVIARNTDGNSKNDSPVQSIPKEIKMKVEDNSPSKVFKLQAWQIHIGDNALAGHWVYYKLFNGNVTVEVNDHVVTSVTKYHKLEQASLLLYNLV